MPGEPPDREGLPRQRRGTAPQMRGRFPDYDVLDQAGHWDEVTRKAVLDRVHNVPPIRFFDTSERDTLEALCDHLTAQDCEPRIPVLNYVDEKLHEGKLDGYQYYDMPDDRDVWRMVARGLDEEAMRRASVTFGAAWAGLQHEIVTDFSDARLHGGAWSELNVSHAFSVIMRGVVQAFYSHPWAWNEIGFGGPAYPRGYARFGSPHLQSAERESWESVEAFEIDPVRDVQERGLR
jgi:Gluconate 2-dehydrogenase subunit 3